MRIALRKSAVVGFLGVGLSLLTIPAQADPALPIPAGILNFLAQNPGGSAPKTGFSSFSPVGWTGGGDLVFIATPGGTGVSSSACGSTYLTTAGCPSTLAIPGGYNEVEADGNPIYEQGFQYNVTGLTAGVTYTLTFYQAASQQLGFSGATTEQWIVALGGAGLVTNCSSNPCTYSDAGGSVATSTLMSTPNQGLVDWNQVSVNLTANGTSDLLSFLAWGDNGNTTNLPPMLFLTGVNQASGLNTPEPTSVALLGTLVLGLGYGVIRRRRAAKV